jgi:hypothetical protein
MNFQRQDTIAISIKDSRMGLILHVLMQIPKLKSNNQAAVYICDSKGNSQHLNLRR